MSKRHASKPSCPRCNENNNQARGKDCRGNQRYWCKPCRKMFSIVAPRALDTMRLPQEKVVQCLKMLLEGMSIRSCERLTGVNRNTLCKMVVTLGPKCEEFLRNHVRNHPFKDLQIDEQWAFIYCKQKTANRLNLGPFVGDCYVFTALDRDTKFIVGFHCGHRDGENTDAFLDDLRPRVGGWPRISTDGFSPYEKAIPEAFGRQCHYGQIVKVFGNAPSVDAATRYSPPVIIRVEKNVVCGAPVQGMICTSHAERQNLNNRMQVRRMTRLTNGFSKKWENHGAMLAIWFLFYNYCRPHMGFLVPGKFVPPTTPAMKAGIADHKWTVEELLTAVA